MYKRQALEHSNADINAEIKQTNKKIKESNKELTAKVAEIGESNKELTAKVTEVGEKVHTVETKINERFKVFETTMQKSFNEQVTRMEGRFKEHIIRCEKQTADVAKKVDSLVIKIQANATETQRQVSRLDASIVETRSNIESNKESVLQALNVEILKVRQEVRRRSAPDILIQGSVDEKNRVYFTGENNETVSYTHLDVYKRQELNN